MKRGIDSPNFVCYMLKKNQVFNCRKLLFASITSEKLIELTFSSQIYEIVDIRGKKEIDVKRNNISNSALSKTW